MPRLNLDRISNLILIAVRLVNLEKRTHRARTKFGCRESALW
jgi:hypothetical protein